eukprot:1137345-Pelagomonas_calceolata.AAC.8
MRRKVFCLKALHISAVRAATSELTLLTQACEGTLKSMELAESVQKGALVEEPTVSMVFMINTSPFAGKEGKYVTTRNLKVGWAAAALRAGEDVTAYVLRQHLTCSSRLACVPQAPQTLILTHARCRMPCTPGSGLILTHAMT